MTERPAVQRVIDAASASGIRAVVEEYPDGTRTAADAAAAVGCDVAQIVKSMIFTADDELVLALTSGANQVDPKKLANLAGATKCGRADPEQVREATGFAIGGVSPFGHRRPVRTWVDPSLLAFDRVWVAAGTPRHVFPLGPDELVRATGATAASFCVSEEVGVGPHPRPWPEDPRLDPELLAEGDRRNVVDRYRYWSVDAIVADLDQRRHEFHVAIENWQHDFNIGTVVRTANAFLAREVHIIGKRKWNRRGAMVTDRYQHIRHHPTVEAFAAFSGDAGLTMVGIDNLPGSTPLESDPLPRRSILVFGQEGPGLSAEIRPVLTQTRSIAQFGSTRSINAGVAAGIAMHAWIRDHSTTGGTDGE